MIFGNLILGGFGILISKMSQVQTILSFQGCDIEVLRLHTAGTENPDTPKRIWAPSISMNNIQIPPDTPQTPPSYPLDISREQETPTDNKWPQQTLPDVIKQHFSVFLGVWGCLFVSGGVCCCLLASPAPWRCMVGVWGMSGESLGVSEWYSWKSEGLGCVWGYLGSQSLQYGAVTPLCHNPETKE